MFALALLCLQPAPVRAAGVVGDGTPASCTSAALVSAIAAGSGTITFACGAAPVSIVTTQPGGLVIPNGIQITIDGGSKVELSGGLAWRVFLVNVGGSLTLKNLTITKGYSANDDGGAIRNDGSLNIEGCVFSDNLTTDAWSGGGIVSYGLLTISGSKFHNNHAGNGGAVYPRFAAAITSISNTTFDNNLTTNTTNGWGGALLLWDGAPVTLAHDNFNHNTANSGGAIFVQGASSLLVSATQFAANSTQVSYGLGGAIYSLGALTVNDNTFDTNHAGYGGAIFMESGTTSILRGTFTHNWAKFGGAYEQGAGILTAADSWFNANGYDLIGNPITQSGGALSISGGSAALNNLTLSANWAYTGGGLYLEGIASLQNVTISGNHAGNGGGGGIYQATGNLTLTHVTLYQNSATSTGGIQISTFGTVTVRNTIIANNTPINCAGPFASFAFDLSSDSSCWFGLGRDNVSIQLKRLYNYGGFAPTHLPEASSPAVDNASTLYCPLTDQRGVARPQGAACDVGAVELIPGELTPMAFLPVISK